MKKFSDPKFLQTMMKDIQKMAPNTDLESMTEEPTEPLSFFDVTAQNYAELVEKLMA